MILGEVTSITSGLFVRIEGENTARTMSYKRLSSYTPVVGDRVLIVKISGTFVVLGKVV